MQILRTPDDCFANLPDFPWQPTYREVTDSHGDTLRIASIEAGPEDGPCVLLMHGEPSWSFLYRFMIARLLADGCRVVAPDLVGFGRSDKPAATSDYTYAKHVEWMSLWFNAADLNDITLFCQDWGGLIGLRLVAAFPERFARVVTANTFLPTGDRPGGPAFDAWKQFSQTVPVFPTGQIIQRATVRKLSPEEVAAYDAPYPDESFKAGARIFPALVPVSPDNPEAPANRAAWEVLSQWQKPWLTLFSDQDPITKGADKVFHKLVPGTANQPHHEMVGGGHFLQEDVGEALAERMLAWMQA
ncbi:haloalkane dehalogenase [Atopomonas sediminilitoris]|uniref:haloalkane dehalogenase n=1 Tax=Atopomonas sediminilitoris TaxID=2919919 RepID=UPI001F4E46C4|nr:haloalkane dehalogenase [Atopomonas sediminilitoris]MCJ8169686.1 haloalkane dehalogenase [Atopomonas sediminilitoris]